MSQRKSWPWFAVVVACGWAGLSATASRADVKLANAFTNHMVLQQGIPAPVWGTAGPNEQVTVTVAGQTAQATADATGKWMAKVPPLQAGGPHELVVKGTNEIKLADVMVGEVWIASGQSNMEWAVGNGSASEQEKASANYPAIRMFTVQKSVTGKPAADVASPNDTGWVVCTPQSVNAFSAVGYFFAKELHKSLGVPVGIIHTSWGGTPAESWAHVAALESDPDLKPIVDRWAQSLAAFPEQLATWQKTAEQADAQGLPVPGVPQDPRSNPWRAGGLYNAMIAPLVPYGIKGAIWYQGESNANRAYQYRKLLPAMIKTWRDAWGQGDFPFLIVQLANFTPPPTEPGESDWAELREAQAMTAKQPNNGLAIAIDIGDAADIHPRNKEDVGKRLALVALAKNYGKSEVVYSGPEYESMAVEGDKVRLKFQHAAGLVAKDGAPGLKSFAVAGEDKKWHWAEATIDGETVVVHSAQVARPVAVRYAWAHNPPTNLYNKAGLPAVPFRTDDWKGVTADAVAVRGDGHPARFYRTRVPPMPSIEDRYRALARRWFKEVWDEGREETIDELCAPDAVIHGLGEGGKTLIGPANFRRFYHQFKSGLPDIRVTVDDVLAAGDQTTVRVTCRATHTGPGLGVEPTGRPVVCSGIVWIRWRDGRVVEAWNEFDAAGLMAQIAGPGAATVKAR